VALMRELLDAGDRAGVLRHFTALTDALERELGIGPSAEASAVRELALTPIVRPAVPVASPRAATLADQRVSFCHTPDDVRLAYAVSGSGPPLVKASNWLTHLDHDWESPIWQPWWSALSQRHTLVRYDERGCGLSDWEVDDDSFTLEAWVRDLETVVDAMALERFPLLGISQGGPIAVTYAARHPERVSHVVVYGTCARATWARADDEQRRELAALGELIKTSWGGDQPGFRQVYDARFLPDGPLESWRAFDELQRRSASARNAYRLWRAFGDLDCAEAARTLDVPTLILHSSDDRVWSFAEAEELHSMVAGSRLVRLDSQNHILQGTEPAFGVFLDEVHAFLAS
jgi:pimeloyl-ACP methyl ester carboxylesterase